MTQDTADFGGDNSVTNPVLDITDARESNNKYQTCVKKPLCGEALKRIRITNDRP